MKKFSIKFWLGCAWGWVCVLLSLSRLIIIKLADFPSYAWDLCKLIWYPNKRIFQLNVRCPLRDDCKENIRVMILSGKSDIDLDFIFDNVFNSVRDHLKNKHNVTYPFIELQWQSNNQKYALSSKSLSMGEFHKEEYSK